MAFAAASERDDHRRHADLMLAIATGYAGCRSKEGAQALQRAVDNLRK